MKKGFLLLYFTLLFFSAFPQNEDILIGTKKIVQTTVCKVDVDKSAATFNNTYVAPAGWQIVSFKPVITGRSRNVSYSFSKIFTTYQKKNTTNVYSKFIELFELAAEKNAAEKYDSLIANIRSDYERYFTNVDTTYSKIITTGRVAANKNYSTNKKERMLFYLQITLVYIPETEEQFLRSLEHFKQFINGE